MRVFPKGRREGGHQWQGAPAAAPSWPTQATPHILLTFPQACSGGRQAAQQAQLAPTATPARSGLCHVPQRASGTRGDRRQLGAFLFSVELKAPFTGGLWTSIVYNWSGAA